MNTTQSEVWRWVQEMNRTWTVDNKPGKLSEFFHNDMVAITATDSKRIEGGANCVESWKAFAQTAKIHSWKEIDPKVQLYINDTVAVVTYYFDMSFDTGGHTINMQGRDMFTLVKENGKWLAVADQFSAMPN